MSFSATSTLPERTLQAKRSGLHSARVTTFSGRLVQNDNSGGILCWRRKNFGGQGNNGQAPRFVAFLDVLNRLSGYGLSLCRPDSNPDWPRDRHQRAIMVGVKVEATNVETNVTYPGETNAEGLYNIPNLPPGTYRVIVQKSAFQTIVKPDVELHVQDVIALHFSMEVGSVVQSVTAEAGAPLIQATPARGGDFLSSEVRSLPLVGLNPISLARTLPGAIEPAGSFLYGGADST